MTKQRLLNAAERLMLAKGFAATSVEEICDAAKLTKGSFFHYFDSKAQLGREVLERFCASGQQQMQAACAAAKDPLQRVYAHVEWAIAVTKRCRQSQACLLGTFAQELSDTHPMIRSVCANAFTRWAQRLKEDLDAAKAIYAPRARLDTASLAEHFIAVLEGAKILARAKQDPRIEERSLRHFKRYLESVFQPNR